MLVPIPYAEAFSLSRTPFLALSQTLIRFHPYPL